MNPGNDTQISEFFLLGFSEGPELQPLIFGLFLSMYLITVFGNLLILWAVSSDSHLHTPMYFFLANLSFGDICVTSTTVPKMLWNIQTQSKVITYENCITQMYFFLLFAGLDIFLLTVMAYDHFVAICHPLHYMVIMNPRLCGLLVLVSWIMCVLNSLLQTLMVLGLSFCTTLEISHFFCELNQMIQLACSDTSINNLVMYLAAMLLGGASLAGILYSYSKIVSSIHPDMVNPKVEETWVLHLDSQAWLECFTPPCSGNTASLSIINQQEGIQTSTWRRSSHRPHPGEA
ncbi:olfactory receptor 7A5-like [Puma concolor]|uniref:Olfactory receptor 7A5-like n=1 Tax=Puma concolor TaxID=9696 RepID=A0A6P6H7B7_PUMCO|nr:olfactory receptor 7A5-like [Puma concolor]